MLNKSPKPSHLPVLSPLQQDAIDKDKLPVRQNRSNQQSEQADSF